MLFWHPQGTPNIPDSLSEESKTRDILRSQVVYQRVLKRLSWDLSQDRYKRSVDLSSKRHTWNLQEGVFLTLTAMASTPERTRELCNVATEEFSGRCQELALEHSQVLWDLEMAKVQGPLEKWKYDHKALNGVQLQEKAIKLRRRLSLSIAANQMELVEAKKSGNASSRHSFQTTKLLQDLRDIDEALDGLWLKGISNEKVSDLEEARKAHYQRLQESLQADNQAALEELESVLNRLKTLESKLDQEAVSKAVKDLDGLKEAFQSLRHARDLALADMSMYCLPFRKAGPAYSVAATLGQLAPALSCTVLLFFILVAHRRAYLSSRVDRS